MHDIVLVDDKYVKIEKITLGTDPEVTLSTNTVWKIPCDKITPKIRKRYTKYLK